MSVTMTGIPKGQYRRMFQIGHLWEDRAESFRCVAATGEFERLAAFEETEKAEGIEYTDISVTLHKLIGGNAKTNTIPKAQFHRREASGK
jgi:hypothetical protein